MKDLKLMMVMLGTAFLIGSSMPQEAQAQEVKKEKRGWSKKAKGAAVGGAGGAATGAIIGGRKGAVIGAVAGTAAGGAIGRKKDRKKDPVRHRQYSKKDND